MGALQFHSSTQKIYVQVCPTTLGTTRCQKLNVLHQDLTKMRKSYLKLNRRYEKRPMAREWLILTSISLSFSV